MSFVCVPVQIEDLNSEICDTCKKKSKYMFYILDDNRFETVEMISTQCFRCIAKKYWSLFPKI